MDSLRVIDAKDISEENISEILKRKLVEFNSIKDTVSKIIHEVRKQRDSALLRFTKEFDNVELSKSEIKVTNEEIEEAYNIIDEKLLKALNFAKTNLLKFHKAQKKEDWFIDIETGVKAGQIYRSGCISS